MADGDEYLISRGPWRGWTHRSVDLPSASGDGIVVPKNPNGRIQLGYHDFTIAGEEDEYSLKESDIVGPPAITGKTVKGPHPIASGSSAVILAGDGSEGVRTENKNTDLVVDRPSNASCKGDCCYKYEQVFTE